MIAVQDSQAAQVEVCYIVAVRTATLVVVDTLHTVMLEGAVQSLVLLAPDNPVVVVVLVVHIALVVACQLGEAHPAVRPLRTSS